ncbi:Phosphotransferase enzyme family protein [Actinacidiphila alni]|uniref:Phosphotransferase enzyme family protein n=1 Tax=Actinacidiphila alni TaxID=380248 RepID=A0A1I2HNZ5_9ACTN|nr:aminoglycoside phosphotransferase family protein [Actinacidiphila alni]SFF31422.1 Phosphotransferase enzyme family protein [Actinacidiphila alni]
MSGSGDVVVEAAGVRAAWGDVPEGLRREVETYLGGTVVEARTQRGGFSPGVAARLRLADGRRAFVKAVSAAANPDSPGIHRTEAKVAAALPPQVPAPRLHTSFESDGWVLLLFDDVEGRPPAQPWAPAELTRVLAAVADLATLLTPSPVAAPPVAAKAEMFSGWRTLAAEHAAGTDDLTSLDPWAVRRLAELAALESGWADAARGDTLAHADLRADNLLLTADGRVMVVDWPWACVAAPWFDLLLMLPSVAMQGGPHPAEIFDRHPVAAGADPAGVTAVVAAVAGFMLGHARRPAPPGLPTLRAFQYAQGVVALDWLRTRTGLS